MLAHLGPDNVDSHRPAGIDAIPDSRFEQFADAAFTLLSRREEFLGSRGEEFHRGEAGPGVSEHDAGPHHGDQEAAARRLVSGPNSVRRQSIHWWFLLGRFLSSSHSHAASLMALRMRT